MKNLKWPKKVQYFGNDTQNKDCRREWTKPRWSDKIYTTVWPITFSVRILSLIKRRLKFTSIASFLCYSHRTYSYSHDYAARRTHLTHFTWTRSLQTTKTLTDVCMYTPFIIIIIFSGSAAHRGLSPPHITRFLDHTQRSATVGRTPLDEWSARRRDHYLTTHNTHTTNIHASGGLRTHDRSRRAAVHLRLRPRGHWDRLYVYSIQKINRCELVPETAITWY
jgi:hypothetical protein